MGMRDAHLNELREKRKQWNDCLNGEDVNTITSQLARMTWDIVAFRVLVEAHNLGTEEVRSERFNAFPFRLLHKCFSESLLIGFRRLMDNCGLDGNRGVYSLASLLKDIHKSSHLLTREAITSLLREELQRRYSDSKMVGNFIEIKHEMIDKLTGIATVRRTPNDQIPSDLFEERLNRLKDKFEAAEKLINKVIAHAATKESRNGNDVEPLRFDDLYEFHAELCKTAHMVQCVITDTSDLSFLPTIPPSDGEFQSLTMPLLSNEDIPRVKDRWNELAKECESWHEWPPGDK